MSAIEAFADDLLYRMAASCGELAVELGLTAVGDRNLPPPSVPDFSEETALARGAMMDDATARLARLGPPDPGAEAITRRVLDYLLDQGMFGPYAGSQGRAFAAIPYPLNHLSGHHATTVALLARDFPATSGEDAQACLEALRACPQAIDGSLAAFRVHEAAGVSTPRSSLARARANLRAFMDAGPAQNAIVGAYGKKLRERLGPAAADAWSAKAEGVVRDDILPAYARQIEVVEERLGQGPGEDGFWRHPDGEAHYAWLLRAHTTTDLSPQAVHELGLEETKRVQSAIRREFSKLGIEGGSIADLYAAVSGPEHAAFGPGPASRERALTETRTLIAEFQRRAAPLFALWPRASVDVELISAEAEDSQHSCYTPPMEGGGRPGLFSLNLKQALDRPAWELPVLCAHEAAPGHHVQLALAQELPLCAFRRAIIFTAYIEGWAKYAETLLDEVLMNDPYVRLGRLRGELYSSVNLALDTGVHALRWTRQGAAAFFKDSTGVSDDFAASIVDRSLVSPGQLCAYKIGMQSFLELGARFTARDGGDRRAFHDAVLGQGALPLRLLEEIAEEALRSPPQAADPVEMASAR